jgi:lysophospholipase L1-like esterase
MLCLVELPHHFAPTIAIHPSQPVYVIGDSISAGVGSGERLWPDVLGELSHLNVTNLAKPGATVESALAQAKDIRETNALVLVEIGGNDMLGGADSRTFYAQLDTLLEVLDSVNRQVVMFELPLPSFCNDFGKAQRILAKKHNIILIPKRYLTAVFGAKDATLDGLHLSQTGHATLAVSINGLLEVEEK